MYLFRSIAIAIVLPSIAFGQDLITVTEAEAVTKTRVETTTTTEGIGESIVYSPSVVESTSTVTVIAESNSVIGDFGPPSIEFEDASTGVDASEAFEQIGTDRVWVGRKPGKYRVRASAVDRQTFAIRTQRITVTVSGGAIEPDESVSNTYGVGHVAFAVDGEAKKNDLLKLSQIYRDAANRLYGNPAISIIAPPSESRSVFRWIKDQTTSVTGDWSPWQGRLDEAFLASQLARQYTREDWFAALNEVSQALEARAK